MTDDGVALPAFGVSVFGVDVRRNVLGMLRDSGDWITGVMLIGSGGKAEVAGTCLEEVSATIDGLEAVLAGTEIFKLGVDRFSDALLEGWLA